MKSFSGVRLFATPWTIAYQAPPSMGFSRQKYWSGLPFPSPGDRPNPGIELRSPALQADALPVKPPGNWGVLKPNITNGTICPVVHQDFRILSQGGNFGRDQTKQDCI